MGTLSFEDRAHLARCEYAISVRHLRRGLDVKYKRGPVMGFLTEKARAEKLEELTREKHLEFIKRETEIRGDVDLPPIIQSSF